jgi:hypothetical protein
LIEYAGKPNDNPTSRESKDLLKMLFAQLKLMVSLTMPAMLVFDGATEKIETTREFVQVVGFLQQYKVTDGRDQPASAGSHFLARSMCYVSLAHACSCFFPPVHSRRG